MDETGEHHSKRGQPGLEDQKSYVFLSYVDFRSRANTAMLLDLGHMLRGEHMWEVWG
jgi:hypothetical protein